MERFSRLFMAFLALSFTFMRASSFGTSLSPLPTTTRVKQHPQLQLIHRSNGDAYDRSKRQGGWRCYSTNEPSDNQEDTEQNIQTAEVTADSLTPSQIQSLSPDSQTSSFFGTLKSFFSNKKNKFSRESLGKLGMSALLAYGFVSNISGVIAVSCAWFIFCTRVSVHRSICLLPHVYILLAFDVVRTCQLNSCTINQSSHRLFTQTHNIRRVYLHWHLGKKQRFLEYTPDLQ